MRLYRWPAICWLLTGLPVGWLFGGIIAPSIHASATWTGALTLIGIAMGAVLWMVMVIVDDWWASR